MAISLKASQSGLKALDEARTIKGWYKSDKQWSKEANTTSSTLKRLWTGNPIRRDTFIAVCEAVEVNWKDIADFQYEPDELIGKILRGRYKILERLDQNNQSEIRKLYLAKDLDINLSSSVGHPKCYVEQFQFNPQDKTELSSLNTKADLLFELGKNQYLPSLLANFYEGNYYYFIGEWIEGDKLTDELEESEGWSEENVIVLLKKILKLLHILHQKNIVHRRINPEKIIIKKEADKINILSDCIYLVGLETIKPIPNNSTFVKLSMLTAPLFSFDGTNNAYMPPDYQLTHFRLNSDIYSLGIIAIQAITGIAPIYQKNIDGNIICNNQLQSIDWNKKPNNIYLIKNKKQVKINISHGLGKILDKMTKYYFKERYQSAQEVLNELEQLFPSYF